MFADGRGRYRVCRACSKLFAISEWSFATRSCNGCAGTRCADYRSSCTGAVANSGWGNVVILEHADGTWTTAVS
jgi:hypothetical protein